jgi:putative flippase GtrA
VYLTFLRFGLVGASGALVNTAVFWLVSGHAPAVVAAALAFELALVSNFALNHCWTFHQRRAAAGRQFLRYQTSALGALALQAGVLQLLVGLGMTPVLANLLGIAVGMGWNFTTSICWTWRSASVTWLAQEKLTGRRAHITSRSLTVA